MVYGEQEFRVSSSPTYEPEMKASAVLLRTRSDNVTTPDRKEDLRYSSFMEQGSRRVWIDGNLFEFERDGRSLWLVDGGSPGTSLLWHKLA